MGTGGTSENSGHDGADNVIRFPRDWFGSTDDLIPFGSAADRLEEDAAAAERESTHALSADDFWGESSEALHQPVDVPRADDATAAVLRENPPSRAAVVASSRDLGWARMLRAPRLRVVHVRVPRAALLLAAMLTGGVALFLSGAFGTSSTASRVGSRETATSVAAGQAPKVQFAQAAIVSGGQDAVLAASHVKAARARVGRRVTRKAGRTKAAAHGATKTHRPAPAAALKLTHVSPDLSVTPAAAEDSTSAGSNDTQAQSGAAENTATSSGAASDSRPATSSAASSANAPGPTGLGTSTGCNPKCS